MTHDYSTLVAMLRERAARSGSVRAYTFLVDGEREGATFTYSELDELVKQNHVRNWAALHTKLFHPYHSDNPDLPVLDPWVLRTKPPAERFEPDPTNPNVYLIAGPVVDCAEDSFTFEAGGTPYKINFKKDVGGLRRLLIKHLPGKENYPYPPIITVISPFTILSGGPSDSRIVSPNRQAGRLLINTVAEPSMTTPTPCGGASTSWATISRFTCSNASSPAICITSMSSAPAPPAFGRC